MMTAGRPASRPEWYDGRLNPASWAFIAPFACVAFWSGVSWVRGAASGPVPWRAWAMRKGPLWG
jgi:hypothetical protein